MLDLICDLIGKWIVIDKGTYKGSSLTVVRPCRAIVLDFVRYLKYVRDL